MNVQNHPVVSREEWLAARKQHLAHEKAFTRERDKLSAERRALPWVLLSALLLVAQGLLVTLTIDQALRCGCQSSSPSSPV